MIDAESESDYSDVFNWFTLVLKSKLTNIKFITVMIFIMILIITCKKDNMKVTLQLYLNIHQWVKVNSLCDCFFD